MWTDGLLGAMHMHAVILEVEHYSSKFSWQKGNGYPGGSVSLGRIWTGMKGKTKGEGDSLFNFTRQNT